MSVVALVIAPSIALDAADITAYVNEQNTTEVVVENQNQQKGVEVEMVKNNDGTAVATVKVTTIINGVSTIEETIVEGSTEEVKAKVATLKATQP